MPTAETRSSALLQALRHGLVVSCQPLPNSAMDRPEIIVAMAAAATAAGAAGVRIEGVDNVAAVAAVVKVPVIGIVKRDLADCPIRITPRVQDAEALLSAGAAIVAFDATSRRSPAQLKALVDAVRAGNGVAMADCSTFAEGVVAAELGSEIVGTTLSGYTGGPVPTEPDFRLIERWAARDLCVMAEGRIKTPRQATQAMEHGAWSVTVGSAITRIEHITQWFVSALTEWGE